MDITDTKRPSIKQSINDNSGKATQVGIVVVISLKRLILITKLTTKASNIECILGILNHLEKCITMPVMLQYQDYC